MRTKLENTTQTIAAHDPQLCKGSVCSVHNPSDHAMRRFRQYWRYDRQLMERICPHGVGHPDPDHLAHLATVLSSEAVAAEAVHGCDGCCQPKDEP